MLTLTFSELLGTPAPTAPFIGILAIVLFGIMAVVVGPDYEGMNFPAKKK